MTNSTTTQSQTVVASLELVHKAGGFASRQALMSWLNACLNSNTNHVEAKASPAGEVPVFYVRGENADCVNIDLIVAAPSSSAATEIWRDNFALEGGQVPDSIGLLPGVTVSSIGALDWGVIQSSTEVLTALPALAPAIALAGFTDEQLINELRRRRLVVSTWSPEDLSFLDDEEGLEHLSAEELDAFKPAIFDRVSDGLYDILTNRGNTHLEDKWRIESDAIMAELKIPTA